jgi:hypothetical protein
MTKRHGIAPHIAAAALFSGPRRAQPKAASGARAQTATGAPIAGGSASSSTLTVGPPFKVVAPIGREK